MPMGDLNADPTCESMIMKLQMECYTVAKECGLKHITFKVIVDNVLLYGRIAEHLLAYFRTVLYFMKHH